MRCILVLSGILFGLAACDSGDSTPAERDRYGQCYQVAGRACPAGKVYYDCIASTCGTQLDACLTPCTAAFDCQRACPCDATNADCVTDCFSAMTTECSTCLSPAFTCINGSTCARPECLTVEDAPPDAVEPSPDLAGGEV